MEFPKSIMPWEHLVPAAKLALRARAKARGAAPVACDNNNLPTLAPGKIHQLSLAVWGWVCWQGCVQDTFLVSLPRV